LRPGAGPRTKVCITTAFFESPPLTLPRKGVRQHGAHELNTLTSGRGGGGEAFEANGRGSSAGDADRHDEGRIQTLKDSLDSTLIFVRAYKSNRLFHSELMRCLLDWSILRYSQLSLI